MTKSVSAAAALASPTPSLFSDSGTLAQRLVEAYLAVRNETERRAAPGRANVPAVAETGRAPSAAARHPSLRRRPHPRPRGSRRVGG